MRLRSGTIAANLWFLFEYAGIAQLVEQLICNQQVVGSSPTAGSLGTPSTSASADNAVNGSGRNRGARLAGAVVSRGKS